MYFLYGAPGVDLLAAVSSESKNLYSLPTNPTHPPLCYCWWHNLHWMFQWEFLCCIFAVYKFSWFSNVRFLLEVHCTRIAWRGITISIWHAKRDISDCIYDPLTQVCPFHMHRLTIETLASICSNACSMQFVSVYAKTAKEVAKSILHRSSLVILWRRSELHLGMHNHSTLHKDLQLVNAVLKSQ